MDNMEATQNQEVNVDDDIDVQIEDQTEEKQATSSEDELENYTKSVSKRVNKLNDRIKQEAERAAYLEAQLLRKEQENQALKTQTVELNTNLFAKEEESLASKEREADQLYRKAVEANDAELLSKADTLKSDIAIQKEKIRLAKQRQEQQNVQQVQQPQEQAVQYQQQQPQQEAVEPTQEALGWYENNKWYGDSSDPQNAQATQFAYFTHFNLVNEGFEPDSDDYYNELNQRVYKVYPHLQGEEPVEKNEGRPAVQRVASTSVGSRQQTQGRKNGVTFSKSEIERLKGLKPYNMSEDQWLKRVAKEKLKAQQKGA
jgi:murein DD-endopeptidase MepM/ murein hydrolase activator NlpD